MSAKVYNDKAVKIRLNEISKVFITFRLSTETPLEASMRGERRDCHLTPVGTTGVALA